MSNLPMMDICPLCNNKAENVSSITIDSLVKDNLKKKLKSFEGFYFCKTSDCKVIYFRSNEIILQEDLRVEVGIKTWANPSLVCYCFNWSKQMIEKDIKNFGKTNALQDITSLMKTDQCACEINNPSGKCCLKDIKKTIKNLTYS